MYALKDFSKVQGALIFLLVLTSLIWRGTSNLSVLIISYSCILLATLSVCLFLRSQHTYKVSLPSILLMVWLGWITLLPALNLASNNAIPGFFQCSVWIMAFFIFSTSNAPQRLWSSFIKTMSLFGFISAVYALNQFFILHEMPAGFFANKNTGAAFLMLSVLLLVGEFTVYAHQQANAVKTNNAYRLYPIFLGLSIYLLTLTLFISLSRGVLIAFTLFLILELLLIAKYLPKKRLYLLMFILLLAVFSLLFFAHSAILHRMDVLHHEKSRFIIWQGAWDLWQKTPWYGLGIFNFARYYPAFSLPGDGSTQHYAHNDFLQLLIETGIPGILLLIAAFFSLIYSLVIYLQKKHIPVERYIHVVACSAALGSFLTHSVVDFNFYVLPMNLILGCCLGYLHSELNQETSLWNREFNLTTGHRKLVPVLCFLYLCPITIQALNLMMLDHYSQKADFATKQQDYPSALKLNSSALKWFDDYEVHSYQADVYFQLANQAKLLHEKNKYIQLMKHEINASLKANAYYARAYFQRALLQAALEDNAGRAIENFYKALKNNPQFCLARITFALFFIDKNKLHDAQQILEDGLSYPIPAEYAENYLNYLAKLRSVNGDYNGSEQVTERLEQMDFYNSDYSALIA